VLGAASAAAEGHVWVVFQPHTTNRTATLMDEFAASFDDAEHALILPIYRPTGREAAARPVEASDLVAAIARHHHPDVRYVDSFDAAVAVVTASARPGDVVMTLGAGDVTLVADRLLRTIQR
jgi:UDP-N-acetylmuramate--alanine ligase